MRSPRRPWRRRVLDRLVGLADLLVPAGRAVVVHSSPDLDDSTVALLRGAPPGIDVIVLAEDLSGAQRRADALVLRPRLLGRRSRRGLLAYLRSPVAVTTHGVFGARRRPRGKQVVGLWHGEFGKRIGTFVGERPRHFDWVPVSSQLARQVRSAEFALDPARIHVVGSPRQALLEDPDAVRRRLGLTGPQVVVAPTYRVSVQGMARADGDVARVAQEEPWTWPETAALLEEHGATIWLRPHPAADQQVGAGERVRLARNRDLEELGVTFYELLGAADCLVTDYSSIWVDHLVRDVPVLGFCPDLEVYRRTRGLALEPYEEWFPGPVVGRGEDLVAERARVLAGHADHAARRRATRALLVDAAGTEPVARTWDAVRERVGRRPAAAPPASRGGSAPS
ncbi:CDP-glycerol glycerophosphotransferase family protein [Nocardioides sp.]|uniref:CDP-glycerol glycerophosphotransferase family protein n=1 Tax=Nocardioides sp. TaxID=35761 RepID=UPI003511314E